MRELTFYKGYYGNILICCSTDKKLIHQYMQYHRHLSPKEYSIKKEIGTEIDLYQNEDYLITAYGDYYIPNIDILTIETFHIGIKNRLQSTVDTLQLIGYSFLSSKKKKWRILGKFFQKAVEECIHIYQNEKALKLIDETDIISNSILYEKDIKVYLRAIQNVQDMKSDHNRFLEKMYED